MKIHFVKAGETLYEITVKYGVTVEEIMAVNKSVTDPNTIIAGMKLIIPVKKQVHNPMPVYPEQALSHSTPQSTPQTMPQSTPQTMPQTMPQSTPQVQAGPYNQGFNYPGQAVPPFAAIPMPAYPVTASGVSPATMPVNEQTTMPTWAMPTGYTAYNTPYHMTNYSMPNSYPNLGPNLASNFTPNLAPNSAYHGIPQVTSNYQPYTTNMMEYPNSTNYEYYNTYSTLQSNAEWPSHNPQPHGQFNQTLIAPEAIQPQLNKQEDLERSTSQQENKKARTSSTSSTSKERLKVKAKRNTLHDQVVRLHQSRNKANRR